MDRGDAAARGDCFTDRRDSPSTDHCPSGDAAELEHRLNRLRFDLHDGPLQEVHLLAEHLRLFRDELRPMVEDHPDAGRALARLDDLEAQIVALDADLRRLSTAATRSPLPENPLAEALAELAGTFRERTGIAPRTELSGPLETLTASERTTVLSIVRESLSNVRRHSDAGEVDIRVTTGAKTIEVAVRDDGHGFAPDVAGPEAAGRGRLGLVGMRQRAEMLGGRTEIRSAPGGPTIVSAFLPRRPAQPG